MALLLIRDIIAGMGKQVGNGESREWNECSLICRFLSRHGKELSKETRTMLERRIAAIADQMYSLDNPPQPY